LQIAWRPLHPERPVVETVGLSDSTPSMIFLHSAVHRLLNPLNAIDVDDADGISAAFARKLIGDIPSGRLRA